MGPPTTVTSPLRSLSAALLISTASLALGCDVTAEPPDDDSLDLPVHGSDPFALHAEAGFITVSPNDAFHTEARMFYDFHPADHDAAHAPLVVLFNGGPGFATSAGLLSHGTGPYVVDTDAPELTAPVLNDGSWTTFANVLYVDPRTAGWSQAGGCEGFAPELTQVVADAGDFVQVVLAFLDAHPRLTSSDVVFAGESYGGTRAVVMTYMLQHYTEFDETMPWLRAAVQAHVDRARPQLAGAEATPEQMAEQFGHMVLIQANVAGRHQFELERPGIDADPILSNRDPDADGYDIRRTQEEGEHAIAITVDAMQDPDAFEALTGVPQDSVEGLGDLFVPMAPFECRMFLGDEQTLVLFGDVATRTKLFITRAKFDSVVYADVFPALFEEVGWTTSVDQGAGTLRIEQGEATQTIPFPKYDAGHEVPATAAVPLRDDVRAWLGL